MYCVFKWINLLNIKKKLESNLLHVKGGKSFSAFRMQNRIGFVPFQIGFWTLDLDMGLGLGLVNLSKTNFFYGHLGDSNSKINVFVGTLFLKGFVIYFLQSQGQLTRDDDFMKLGGKYFRY